MTGKEKKLTETFLETMEGEGFVASLKIAEKPDYSMAERNFSTSIEITLSKLGKDTGNYRALRETEVSFVSDFVDILGKQENGG
jgi:hypothetical protein